MKKIFTHENIIPILLIVSPYSFIFAKSLSIGYVFILILTLSRLLDKESNFKFSDIDALIIALILVIISMFSLMNSRISPVNNIIIRNFQILIWGLYLSTINIKKINKQKLIQNTINIGVIASYYGIIQTLVNSLVNYRLPNILNFGLIVPTTLDLRTAISYRPASFFEEPSYLGSYLLVCITILLFNSGSKQNHKKIILFALTIILTTSSSAIYMILLLLFFKFISNKINLKNIIKIITFVLICYIIIKRYEIILLKFGDVGENIRRSIIKYQSFETSSRIGNSYNYLNGLHGIHKSIGLGIGNEFTAMGDNVTYINSVTRLVLNTGYLGMILFGTYVSNLFLKSKNKIQYSLLTIYIIKSFTGGALLTLTGMFFLSYYYILKGENLYND